MGTDSNASTVPGFTAKKTVDYTYKDSMFQGGYQPFLFGSITTAAALDTVCYNNCVKECPTSGSAHVICVNGCKNECTPVSCGSCRWVKDNYNVYCRKQCTYKSGDTAYVNCSSDSCANLPCPSGTCGCYVSSLGPNCSGDSTTGRCICIN